MQWWADDTGRRGLPCSGGLITLEGGASMQWWADDTGRRGLPCSGGLMALEGGRVHAVVG